jgi:hypothetical protein
LPHQRPSDDAGECPAPRSSAEPRTEQPDT